MKKLLILIAFLLLLLTGGFPKSALADEVFDRYESSISWNEQRAHLDNFINHLQTNKADVGYVILFISKKDSLKKINYRIDRSIKYLTQNGKIEKSRLKVIKVGKRLEKSEIILQPTPKNLPPPNFN